MSQVELKDNVFNCEECGNEYNRIHSQQKFCGYKCYRRFNNKKVQMKKKIKFKDLFAA